MSDDALVEVVGDKIWARFPWRGKRGVEVIKTIQGGRWAPEKKIYKFPLSWETCLEIRRVCNELGLDIEFGDNMKEWAATEKVNQARVPDVRKAPKSAHDTPNIRQNNPAIFQAIQSRPFQTVTPILMAVRRAGLLADDPGLGKTLQTFASVEEAGLRGPHLVVGPKSAIRITWPAELGRWLPNDKFGTLGPHLTPAQRESAIRSVFDECEADPSLRYWVLTTSHYVRLRAAVDEYNSYIYEDGKVKIIDCNMPSMFERKWSAIVLDESHRFVAMSTGNKKKMSAQAQGLGALQITPDGIRMALSGTPFRGKPSNLYGTLQWLRPDIYTSYWKWAGRYFDLYDDSRGGKVLGSMKNKKRFYKEHSNVLIRREKGEVAPDLPPKMYGGTPLIPGDENSVIGVWLDMEGKQKKAYEQLVSTATAHLRSNTLSPKGILAEITRLKQFASAWHDMEIRTKTIKYKPHELHLLWQERRDFWPDVVTDYGISMIVPLEYEDEYEYVYPLDESNKWDWIVEFLTTLGIVGQDPIGDRKVIIASQFTKLLNNFHKRLKEEHGVDSYLLTGETPDKARLAAQEGFQGPDGLRVFFLNTKAGGVSITLDAADDVVIVDETTIPDDQLQVEDRAHRLSRIDHQVTIWYLRTLAAIDESIGSTTTERERLCRSLLDGERGIDTLKILLAA